MCPEEVWVSGATCLSVEVLEGNIFAELHDPWEALLQRTYDNRLFLTPDWVRVWWQHFGSGEPLFVTVRDGQELRALLPLQVIERFGQRVLTLLGDAAVTDYLDALAEREEAQPLLQQSWRAALGELRFDRIELRHVPASSPLIPALQAVAPAHHLAVLEEQDEVDPVAVLCPEWEGYLQTLSKKQRHEVRRKLRRFQTDAEWDYRLAATPQDLERDLPVFFRLHQAGAQDKADFMTETMRAYFVDLCRTFLQLGFLRLAILRRDGVDVAATISFLYRGRYLLYNSGFDPAYAAYSPGIAAVSLAIQDAISSRAAAFDFLSGDEPYKYQLGGSNTFTYRVTAAPQTD